MAVVIRRSLPQLRELRPEQAQELPQYGVAPRQIFAVRSGKLSCLKGGLNNTLQACSESRLIEVQYDSQRPNETQRKFNLGNIHYILLESLSNVGLGLPLTPPLDDDVEDPSVVNM